MFVGPGTNRKWRPGWPLSGSWEDMDKAYNHRQESLREVLEELFRAGVEAAAPGPALSGVLRAQVTASPAGPVWIAALGKAARPMARAALDHLSDLGSEPAGGVVIVPEPEPDPLPGLVTVSGDHPFPGPASLEAARALGRLAEQTGAGDEVWVLLSGGATSLAAAPVDGITAAGLHSLYRSLLSSGLDIGRMNTVRKRFSRWGAGRLAVALAPARVRTFVVSDVIGDDPAAIGSGPCVPDETRAVDVLTLLETAELTELIQGEVADYLAEAGRDPSLETPKPGHPAFDAVDWQVVAANRLSLDAIARRAEDLGWRPVLVPEPLSGLAAPTGRHFAEGLLSRDPRTCLIAGGETVVRIAPDNTGLGGRSQELALAAAQALAGASCALLAAGTDGRDGPTDAAGAVVDGGTWSRIEQAGRDPARDLAGHNSLPALEAAGDLLVTGLTGTNVMDVAIGIVGD
jgi:glycerate 2-kinase